MEVFMSEEKRKFMITWLNDEDNRRNLRSYATLALALVIIIVYRGFRFGFTLDVIFNFDTLIDFIVLFAVVGLIVNDVSDRADFDESRSNKELIKLEEEFDEEISKITDYTQFAKKIDKHNQNRYALSLERAKTHEKQRLNVLIAKHYTNPKKRKKFEDKLNNVENTMRDVKQFRYYSIDDFLGRIKTGFKDTEIDITYKSKYNVRNRNLGITFVRSMLLIIFRAGMGARTESLTDLIVFLLLATSMSIISALVTYENVRYDKAKNEKIALKKKLKNLNDIQSLTLSE